MSLKAIEAAVRTAVPSNAAWQCMMILAYHHHAKTGRCFPSYERMAEETGLAKSSVTRGIKELKEAGLIEVVKGRRAGTFNAPNSYKLLFLTHQGLLAKTRRPSADDRPVTRPDRETPSSQAKALEKGESAKRLRSHRAAPRRRMAPNWSPTPEERKFAGSVGFTEDQTKEIANDFRDYWIAQGTTKARWGAAFRRWLRREAERRAAAEARGPGSSADRRGNARQDRVRGSHVAALEAVRGLGGRQGGGVEDRQEPGDDG